MLWVQRDGSFENPKHMLILMGKNLFTILRSNNVYLNLYAEVKYIKVGYKGV